MLEASCCAIVLLYLIVRLGRARQPGTRARQLLLLAIAAWIGEETMIRAYGFYSYSPVWTIFCDRVPLAVVVIWPVVIDSARDLGRHLLGADDGRLPLLAFGLILTDAALIEPIAVRAGLWSWTVPGLFDVPVIGILGWAFFGAGCVALLERADRGNAWLEPGLLLFPVLMTHLFLLSLWWGGLRWLSGPIPAPAVTLAAWLLSILCAGLVWKAAAWRRADPVGLLLRIPAAGFFFVLLFLHAGDHLWLVAYAPAFAFPYLLLTPWRRLGGTPPLKGVS